MIRRRRRVREIPFSFDSFLDIVANVVGVIIRLILVVWVGARSYSSLQSVGKSAPAATEPVLESQAIVDPLHQDLEQHRRELAQVQRRFLEQLRQLQGFQQSHPPDEGALTALGVRRQRLEQEEAFLSNRAAARRSAAKVVALSSAELRERSRKLAEEMRALEQLPSLKKTLRYRTPISRPVQAEELLFECAQNKVTFVDIGALLGEVRQGIDEQGKLLRTQWQVEGLAGPVGAFRLHYTLERERGLLDAISNGAVPEAGGSFRYGLSEWQIEPIAAVRGETAEEALVEGSEFRQVVDPIDPKQTAVTFWVYPDSFDLFRRLRDFLYERDVTVAGRPLPNGVPIASSRRGTASRGQ
jgi:hypothetical protein